MESLKSRDAAFADLEKVDPDIRVREDYFNRNSIRGMLEYIDPTFKAPMVFF